MADYVREVRAVNPDGVLRIYPGSPQIALQMTRDHDRLRLFERHSNEVKALQECMRGAGRRVAVVASDGFAGLRSVLPPPSRRGLVLIDPSYENVSEYAAVLEAARDALQRFATGTYAVWYPQVQRRESAGLPARLRRLAAGDWLDVALTVNAPATGGFGLFGSGMFVFNPPWNLEMPLREAMPILVQALGRDEHAAFNLEFRQS